MPPPPRGTISRMATSSPLPLTPELEAFQGEFDAITADAAALLAPLSDTQFFWSPSAEVWSIAECLEHLNATARTYLPMLDSSIATAKQWGVYGAGPFHYGWLGRLIVRQTEPPPRRRFKAPALFQPAERGARRKRSDIEAGFRGYQVQFVDRLRQANGVDLVKVIKAIKVRPTQMSSAKGSTLSVSITRFGRNLRMSRSRPHSRWMPVTVLRLMTEIDASSKMPCLRFINSTSLPYRLETSSRNSLLRSSYSFPSGVRTCVGSSSALLRSHPNG